jgi:hypothetical protein
VTLAERIVALNQALKTHRVPHAFGGAIALAYWTLDPRGTSDIDLNVFVPSSAAARVRSSMPDGVAWDAATTDAIQREDQVRVWWDTTPVDLFFDALPIHADASHHRQMVPFEGVRIPVLGPVELTVFKVMFDRTRDWADIEAMLVAGTVDVPAVRSALATLLDGDDARLGRLQEAERRAAAS